MSAWPIRLHVMVRGKGHDYMDYMRCWWSEWADYKEKGGCDGWRLEKIRDYNGRLHVPSMTPCNVVVMYFTTDP